MAKQVKVSELVQQFQMEVISGEKGLRRLITVDDLNRPGLEITGYFEYHTQERVQLLGRSELAFLGMLPPEERRDRMERLCTELTPCIIVTRGLEVPAELVEASAERDIPVLRTNMATTILSSRITGFLERKLAPTATIHGVLCDVYGVGMLITGSSGIGKSETALELVKRGHRLVADDAVEIRQTSDFQLHGTAPELIRHLLEIRGVGIINVMTLFVPVQFVITNGLHWLFVWRHGSRTSSMTVLVLMRKRHALLIQMFHWLRFQFVRTETWLLLSRWRR